MWQSTGTEMAAKTHTWQSTGIEVAHVWQLFRQSEDTYDNQKAVNGHIRSSPMHMVHTQQSHAHGPYVAVFRAYKRYRDGNKKEQKLVVNMHF